MERIEPAPRHGTSTSTSRGAAIAPVAVALAAWAGLILVGFFWVRHLNATGPDLLVNAPPLAGRFDITPPGARILLPLAVSAAVIALAPVAIRRLGWNRLLVCVFLAGFAWAVALALLNADSGLTGPPLRDSEYLHDIPLVGSPGVFLDNYTERIDLYATHVRGHPPGFIVGLWGLDEIGLGGALPAALVMITGGALAAPAALVALREVAGERRARTAAPFMVLLPAAIWIATSADAFFAGVAAWGVALVVLATGREGRRADLLAVGGGLLLGVTLMLSYGLILIAVIPLAVAIARRRPRPIVLAAVAGLAPLAIAAIAGYWWTAGLQATRETYFDGVASERPYGVFFFTNLSSLAIVLGPAVAVGLAYLRDRRAWLLVGGALLAVALADVSGMSKGEVERIWLPFAIWIALATCALPATPGAIRGWLGAAASFALVVELGVLTSW